MIEDSEVEVESVLPLTKRSQRNRTQQSTTTTQREESYDCQYESCLYDTELRALTLLSFDLLPRGEHNSIQLCTTQKFITTKISGTNLI